MKRRQAELFLLHDKDQRLVPDRTVVITGLRSVTSDSQNGNDSNSGGLHCYVALESTLLPNQTFFEPAPLPNY